MARFSQRFIPRYAELTSPLRDAMSAARWCWGPAQDAAFAELQITLTSKSVLHYYKIGAETQLTVDASPTGLGAILSQKQNGQWVPVCYKSRALKDVESRYSQTEREALAIRWGVNKLRKYLMGSPKFQIITDHRPLCVLFNKCRQELPPRIERFVMDVQGYDYEVVYQPGKNNIADYMSRHPVARTGTSRSSEIEDYVMRVTGNVFAAAHSDYEAVTFNKVCEAAMSCNEMAALKAAVQSGRFDDETVKRYQPSEVSESLVVSDEVVFRGSRVVIPVSLRKRVVKLSHKGHQGLSKTKHLIREFCWFPGIDKAVEEELSACLTCQAVNDSSRAPPIKPHKFPKGPWQEIEMDLQGPYPSGVYLFVLIDRFSKWVKLQYSDMP